MFPGIGEKMATNIVNVLGEDVLDKIIEDKAILNLVPKLSFKKANLIYETLVNYEESHTTIVYLNELGFNMKDSLLIYNFYKDKTVDVIDQNIYKLIDDIDEIAFPKVDEIAKKLDMDPTSDSRVKACIIYIMNQLVFRNGDTFLEFNDIYNSVTNFLEISIDEIVFDNYLIELQTERKVVMDSGNYYLKELSDSEKNIADKVIKLASLEPNRNKRLSNYLSELEKVNSIEYNDKQKEAITKALENHILIITGGPGTGKTTIIKAIVELYEKMNKLSYEELENNIALLAPTGRASKRMSEATQLPASTIHRFLKWNKETNQFGINEYNKDNSELIIIDEVSMIDICLLDSLFKGLTDNIKVVLVGDYNQLPSVGPGQVLKDLIDSNIVDTVHLDLLYRQDENSYITTLAHEIKAGDLSEYFLEPKSDYQFLECSQGSIKQNLRNLCSKLVSKGYDYKRVQLMAPIYYGENGIDSLNKELQDIFNPYDISKRELKVGDVTFRENDKVLQLVNMPDENVFNGDVGIIKRIVLAHNSKSGKNELHIDFDGNEVRYEPKDFNKIKHGFIISIHKAQGSEFEMVVLPICDGYRRMLYRKLIYTAVTRAKKKLIVLGEPQAFVYSVNNNNEYIRKSSLLTRIQDKLYNN